MFARIDSDGDGKVTKDEMTTFMEKMKDKDSSTPATQTRSVSSLIGDSLQYLLDSLSKNSATAQSASAIQQYLTTAQANTLDSLNLVG
jgi:hypothetical protein